MGSKGVSDEIVLPAPYLIMINTTQGKSKLPAITAERTYTKAMTTGVITRLAYIAKTAPKTR